MYCHKNKVPEALKKTSICWKAFPPRPELNRGWSNSLMFRKSLCSPLYHLEEKGEKTGGFKDNGLLPQVNLFPFHRTRTLKRDK